jgi:hypothetical protein
VGRHLGMGRLPMLVLRTECQAQGVVMTDQLRQGPVKYIRNDGVSGSQQE